MRILVTGGSGFIGAKLCKFLCQRGDDVIVLARNPDSCSERLKPAITLKWNSESELPPRASLQNIDAVINLAGEPVIGKRWSEMQKNRVRDSRVLTTRNLVSGILNHEGSKPRVLISGSAIGFYGACGDELVNENSPPGKDFLSDVCVQWEKEAFRAIGEMRVAQLRTGLVLGREGGVLANMLLPFRLGLGGRLGNGQQWMSWIHVDDVIGLILHALERGDVSGPLNVTSPNPVSNREFTTCLGDILHRPTFLTVPNFALNVALGEMAQVVTASARVYPQGAIETKYVFQFERLRPALQNLVWKNHVDIV